MHWFPTGEAVLPYFFEYVDYNNDDENDIQINSNVAFVQMPQTFAGLGLEEDFFDMRNE